MTWMFIAEERDLSFVPKYKYMHVLVYYGDDEMPVDPTLYKENGVLRLPHAGWESLKAMLVLKKDIIIREK